MKATKQRTGVNIPASTLMVSGRSTNDSWGSPQQPAGSSRMVAAGRSTSSRRVRGHRWCSAVPCQPQLQPYGALLLA